MRIIGMGRQLCIKVLFSSLQNLLPGSEAFAMGLLRCLLSQDNARSDH